MRRPLYWVLLVGLIVANVIGFVMVAEAASTYQIYTMPSYENGEDRTLGKVGIKINDVSALANPDKVTVTLPTGVTFNSFTSGASVSDSGSVTVSAPALVSGTGNTNPLSGSGAFTTTMTSSHTFQIWVYPEKFATDGAGQDAVLTVDFYSLDVAGQTDYITASFDASTGSGFTDGQANIARVRQPGTLMMPFSVQTISPGLEKTTDTLLIAETEGGSLEVNSSDPTTYKTVKLTLPEGVTWNEATTSVGGWAAAGTNYFVIGNFNGSDAYVTINNSTTNSSGRLGIFPVIDIDEDFEGELTVTLSGDNPGVDEQTILLARVTGIKILEDNDTYAVASDDYGIKTVTIKPGISGLKYLTAEIYLMADTHDGNESLIFSHFRAGVQQSMVALVNDFDTANSSGQVGFDVQPGDVIKVYLVDNLTADMTSNPVILAT